MDESCIPWVGELPGAQHLAQLIGHLAVGPLQIAASAAPVHCAVRSPRQPAGRAAPEWIQCLLEHRIRPRAVAYDPLGVEGPLYFCSLPLATNVPTMSSGKTVGPVLGRTCAAATNPAEFHVGSHMTRSENDRSDSSVQSAVTRV